MAITQALAEFVMNIKYESIPEEAVNIAKKSICDFFAVAIAGKELEGPRILKEYILEQGGAFDCSVPGHGFKTSAPFSALLSGTMGHVLDYDDVAYTMRGHPSVVIVPVIWALGDKYNISGKQAIEAFMAGFEGITHIVNYTMPDRANADSWHSTKQLGVFCATITAAKILDLTQDQIRTALSFAGTMSGGLRQNFGTMTKSFHAGSAAHDGIMAAILAKKGFSADMNIFEAEYGFRSAFHAGEPLDEEAVLEMMKEDNWDIISSGGITIKMCPACGGTHKGMNAVLELVKRENIQPEDVESITIELQDYILNNLFIHEPETGLEGKFSMEFVAAAALKDRKAGVAQFTDEKVAELKPLMEKVFLKTAVKHEPFVDNTATAEIKMKDGRVFTNTVKHHRGHAKNPLTWEELLEKYEDCVSLYFSKEDVAESSELLRNLEQLGQFKTLVRILAK